jgi:hypothetical protein
MTCSILGAARPDCVPTQRVGTRETSTGKLQPMVAEINTPFFYTFTPFSSSFPRAAWECSTGAPRHATYQRGN